MFNVHFKIPNYLLVLDTVALSWRLNWLKPPGNLWCFYIELVYLNNYRAAYCINKKQLTVDTAKKVMALLAEIF